MGRHRYRRNYVLWNGHHAVHHQHAVTFLRRLRPQLLVWSASFTHGVSLWWMLAIHAGHFCDPCRTSYHLGTSRIRTSFAKEVASTANRWGAVLQQEMTPGAFSKESINFVVWGNTECSQLVDLIKISTSRTSNLYIYTRLLRSITNICLNCLSGAKPLFPVSKPAKLWHMFSQIL